MDLSFLLFFLTCTQNTTKCCYTNNILIMTFKTHTKSSDAGCCRVGPNFWSPACCHFFALLWRCTIPGMRHWVVGFLVVSLEWWPYQPVAGTLHPLCHYWFRSCIDPNPHLSSSLTIPLCLWLPATSPCHSHHSPKSVTAALHCQ